ncbi:hypothetical protein KGM_207810A, partial [Danaus plexippus plexippus]
MAREMLQVGVAMRSTVSLMPVRILLLSGEIQ